MILSNSAINLLGTVPQGVFSLGFITCWYETREKETLSSQ